VGEGRHHLLVAVREAVAEMPVRTPAAEVFKEHQPPAPDIELPELDVRLVRRQLVAHEAAGVSEFLCGEVAILLGVEGLELFEEVAEVANEVKQLLELPSGDVAVPIAVSSLICPHECQLVVVFGKSLDHAFVNLCQRQPAVPVVHPIKQGAALGFPHGSKPIPK
jgi:hypothetical protein